jgi:hypothetical protein
MLFVIFCGVIGWIVGLVCAVMLVLMAKFVMSVIAEDTVAVDSDFEELLF